jgi:DNA-binding NarL/FixJ family response regulator
MPRILIADDHDGTRGILKVLLQGHPGWEVCGEASTGTETLQKQAMSLDEARQVITRWLESPAGGDKPNPGIVYRCGFGFAT